MSDKAIGPGYKDTEVGVIPEDWVLRSAEEVCIKIQDGTHFSPRPGGDDYLYITSKNIGKGLLDISDAERISAAEHKKIYTRCDVRQGDVLLTKDGVNTGNAAINYLDEPFSLLSSVAFLRFDPGLHDPRYFLQFILSNKGQANIKNLMSGNAITRLTLEKIRRLRFPIPPTYEEQRAIAEALSDVDALLSALDRLIAKKRAIKQGAMQALLTGRVRLPGFTGEWKRCTLSEIGTFSKGRGIRKDEVVPNGLPCIRYGEIYTHHNDVVREYYSFIPREVAAKSRRLKKGELLFAGSGETAEEIGKCVAFTGDEEVYAGGDIVIFSPRNQDSIYLGYLMNHETITRQKASFAQGDAIVHISARNLGLLELLLPSLPEQRAIAKVLSDIDAEIIALERRRTKLRDIKQGMMQELLTGRIRLVQTQEKAQEARV